MHDTDRTMLEFEAGPDTFEIDSAEFEFGDSSESNFEGPLDEVEEVGLAAELLDVSNEAELDQFLGKLFRKIGPKVGQFLKPAGKYAFTLLKKCAKESLPGLKKDLLGALPGGLGPVAQKVFGLELEGLEPEDQEFEVARRFVKFASNALAKAAPALRANPTPAGLKDAFASAARQFAPGLLDILGVPGRPPHRPGGAAGGVSGGGIGTTSYPRPRGGATSGRWIRRGSALIILGS
jgi:hypothetical protein